MDAEQHDIQALVKVTKECQSCAHCMHVANILSTKYADGLYTKSLKD